MALPNLRQDYNYYSINTLAIIIGLGIGCLILYAWSALYFHEYKISYSYLKYLYFVIVKQQNTSLTYYIIIMASFFSFQVKVQAKISYANNINK